MHRDRICREFDGPGGHVAHTLVAVNSRNSIVHFDNAERWAINAGFGKKKKLYC